MTARVPPAPSGRELELAFGLLEPLRRLVDPQIEGIDRVPSSGPMLLVGNHTLLGVQDAPIMAAELYHRRDLIVRALGDHAHFSVPVWGDLLTRLGVVRGTRKNCAALMRAGEPVLVYPGGGREVVKRRGEKYRLLWKERMGFARLAIEHGCPVVPFAAVGAEDTFEIVLDTEHPLTRPLAALAERLTGRDDLLFPLVRGVGPTLIPRPQRFYFWFGEPIDTSAWAGRHEQRGAQRELRDRVRAEVEGGIEHLLREREHRDDGSLPRRVVKAALG